MNGSVDETDVLKFLAKDSGFGDGDGAGYGDVSGHGSGAGQGSSPGGSSGYGSGYGTSAGHGAGFGDGAGYGDGYGAGYSYGAGSGTGEGSDIKAFNGQNVYNIDNTMTIISAVHGSYAKGYIISIDLTLTPTYIFKVGDFFAHGDTLRRAREDAFAKYMEYRSVEQRIADFAKAHPSRTRKYAGEDLYIWHGILTGSCRAGRNAWCDDNGLDPKTAKLTVKQFCKLTRDAYGGDIIRQLAKTMGIQGVDNE